MRYTIGQIHEVTGGLLTAGSPDDVLTIPAFDTRRISRPQETIFFALPGASRQGGDFVAKAWDAGVRSFVVPESFDTNRFSGGNFIRHHDVLEALQALAAYHRSCFSGPVIGITGSNGKTIVKEWLFQLLGAEFSAWRSPRSYNSQVGVAISLLGIEPWHRMAIIEAGISKPGEMKKLHRMIRPSLAVCTHFGAAHDEGFSNPAEKAAEKAQLFEGADVVIYPFDAEEIRHEVGTMRARMPMTRFISWGESAGASYRLTSFQDNGRGSTLQFEHRGSPHQLSIPFADKASVENAMTCLCTLVAFERWDEQHLEAFMQLEQLENRLAFTHGKNGNYLVNDSYSNDPDSLEVALDFLSRQQPGMPHTVILSDLDQSDPDKHRLYSRVADLLRRRGTDTLLAVGADISRHQELFSGIQAHFFPDTATLLSGQFLLSLSGQAILIKGSRRFMLEQVYDLLKKQLHKTFLRIDLEALRHNYQLFRQWSGTGTGIMAMVKAFGYGSGSFEAARTLQFMGADYLAVAYADEGVALRDSGIHLPIMVMNSAPADIAARPGYALEPVVFDAEGLKSCALLQPGSRIHLEIDTGMHRLGFDPQELEQALVHLPEHVRVASVFSHLSASEDSAHDDFTRRQIAIFTGAADLAERRLGYPVLRHILNTGGILRFPEARFQLVRLGIGLYGIDPRGLTDSGLRPVTTLLSTISQLRLVKAGESIGYSRRAISDHDRLIATLPVGYADGVRRTLGNERGRIWVNGHYAPLVGSICMDMCMADVTGIACKVGDEVEIFGSHIPVHELAAVCDTIPYEILTGISPRVPRVYVGEN